MHRIVDVKAPDSNESLRNRRENLALLGERDEVKFVLASERDYEFMREVLARYDFATRVRSVLASTVFGKLATRDLVAWVLRDKLPVRVQLQMHKYVWPAETQGV